MFCVLQNVCEYLCACVECVFYACSSYGSPFFRVMKWLQTEMLFSFRRSEPQTCTQCKQFSWIHCRRKYGLELHTRLFFRRLTRTMTIDERDTTKQKKICEQIKHNFKLKVVIASPPRPKQWLVNVCVRKTFVLNSEKPHKNHHNRGSTRDGTKRGDWVPAVRVQSFKVDVMLSKIMLVEIQFQGGKMHKSTVDILTLIIWFSIQIDRFPMFCFIGLHQKGLFIRSEAQMHICPRFFSVCCFVFGFPTFLFRLGVRLCHTFYQIAQHTQTISVSPFRWKRPKCIYFTWVGTPLRIHQIEERKKQHWNWNRVQYYYCY